MSFDLAWLIDVMTRKELAVELVSELAGKVFPASTIVGEIVPMNGGLEAAVARLTLLESAGRQRQIVIKRLTDGARREAFSYRQAAEAGVAPSLFGAVDHEDSTYLFMERVRPVSAWPWKNSDHTRLVLHLLARIHRLGYSADHQSGWDYEDELRWSAAATVGTAEELKASIPGLAISRDLTALRRVAAAISEARSTRMGVLGKTLIHGDVHSGNVVLRRSAGRNEVVLLDWARSRAGSPLEDVSSWLLSLGSWEPAAARDHDSLLRAYLAAAGFDTTLTPELRDAYWIAAASNALAGALRYQLAMARDTTGRARTNALAQARAALRVIRRADERLRRG